MPLPRFAGSHFCARVRLQIPIPAALAPRCAAANRASCAEQSVAFTTNDLPGCPTKGGLLSGTDKPDKLNGFDGDDEIRGLAGPDFIVGGAGNDVIYAG